MNIKSPDPVILSVHVFRRQARKRERALQDFLRHGAAFGEPWPDDLPKWARGVRVRKAGRFQWVVEATENRGR